MSREAAKKNIVILHKGCAPESAAQMEDENGHKVMILGDNGEKEWVWSIATDDEHVVILDNQPVFNSRYNYKDKVKIDDEWLVVDKL